MGHGVRALVGKGEKGFLASEGFQDLTSLSMKRQE